VFINPGDNVVTLIFLAFTAGIVLGHNIHIMKLRSVLLLLLSVLSTGVFAQQDTALASLIRDIPVWMAQNHVLCAGVGIIADGRIKFCKTFGELQQGRPAPDNTLFNIASQTKPVLAMLTLQLVKAGQWNLDEPLARYWIDPDIAQSPYLWKLTSRIVLSHHTGFPNWRSDDPSGKLKFRFEPGTNSGYSGEGYEYLRRALESKFHQPLNALLDSVLFKPLGMTDTRYWTEDLDTNRFAMWHDARGIRYPTSIQTSVNGADDLITTIKDYCTLGIFVMNGAGLPDTLYADMVKKQGPGEDVRYSGLGWGVVRGLPDSAYALQHGGSDIGVRTMAIFLPKTKAGIVVMTNGDNGMFVYDQIIRAALPLGMEITDIMNKGASVHQRVTIADGIIKRYTGAYVQNNGKVLNIEQEGNAIKVSGDGVPTAVLVPESDTAFFMEGYDVGLRFPDGQSLVLYEGGRQVMKISRRADDRSAADTGSVKVDTVLLRREMVGIASDATEGRFTGSGGYLKAAHYVVGRLKAAGVQPGWTEGGKKTYLQPVPFSWDDYSGSKLVVKGETRAHDAANFIVLERGVTRRGKWVVAAAGSSAAAAAASSLAATKGPPAGIILLPTEDQANDWETTVIRRYRFGYMHYLPDGSAAPGGVPMILVSPALAAALRPGDSVSVTLVYRSEHKTGYNVIGIVPGTSQAKRAVTAGSARDHGAIVVGAHLDHIGRIGEHIYNGANDDASGCVAELRAAEMLAANAGRRSAVFVFFCGEELNLKGSRWFADHLPLPDIAAVVNLEQLGSRHRTSPGVWALGDPQFRQAFLDAGEHAAGFSAEELPFSPTDSVSDDLSNTDTYSFMRKHIPSLLLGSGGFSEHHTPMDTIDLIDFEHLQKATTLVFRLITNLTN
jgi:CubicO group peptidase (beta-lactamase class C family)